MTILEFTTNYNLKKPTYADDADILDVNENADVIDEELKANNENIETHKAESATLTEKAHVQHGVINLTLLQANWSGTEAPYTQILTATGIKLGDTGTSDVLLSAIPDYADKVEVSDEWAKMLEIEVTDDDEITVTAKDEPTIDIPFFVKVVR